MLHRAAAIALFSLLAACGQGGEEEGVNAAAEAGGPDDPAGSDAELAHDDALADEAAAAEAADAAVGGNMAPDDVSFANENAASNQ